MMLMWRDDDDDEDGADDARFGRAFSQLLTRGDAVRRRRHEAHFNCQCKLKGKLFFGNVFEYGNRGGIH